ncbi:MAG: Serine/threonine-protein kinase PknB [Verrucomicrobiota bacterium]|jgi:serine/threonine protein kinase
MNESPSSPAPAPFDPDEATLPSSPRNAGAPGSGSGSAAMKFRSKARDLSGTQLGEYKLLRKLAEGGMGEVYEGVQLKLDRRVAVKLLSEELSREPEFLARFEREAKSAAALNHPNVVQVYDYGSAEGQFYFVMELVDGVDLSIHVKEHGKLPIAIALGFFEQAVNALKFAAGKAIIHRDVKPANLMLTRDGQVKVADLGLAKKLTDDSDVTMTGVGMGSPHFLAPEQADDASHVDHRADIYSLGVTLLFLLTGKRPFEGASNFSVVLAHANKPLPTGVDLGTPLPEEIERFIKRMTAKHPAARYQNYGELLADLQRVKAGQRPPVNWGQVVRDPRNLQRLAIAAVVILIAALAVPMMLPDKQPVAPPAPVVNAVEPLPPRQMADDIEGRPRLSSADPAGKAKQMKGKGGRQGGLPIPLPSPEPPERFPIKDGPVPQMLADADRYAAQNKDKLKAIIDRYWQVQRKAEGTQWEAEVQRKSDNAILAHQLATHDVIEKLQAEMQANLQQGKVQESYDVWRKFPPTLQTPETDEEISDILQRFMPPQFQPKKQ